MKVFGKMILAVSLITAVSSQAVMAAEGSCQRVNGASVDSNKPVQGVNVKAAEQGTAKSGSAKTTPATGTTGN